MQPFVWTLQHQTYKTNLAYLCAHLWCASLTAMGVQLKDNLDAIQKTGMKTNSFFNGQFSTKPCKRGNATFNKHVLVSKVLKLACVSVVNMSSSQVLPNWPMKALYRSPQALKHHSSLHTAKSCEQRTALSIQSYFCSPLGIGSKVWAAGKLQE